MTTSSCELEHRADRNTRATLPTCKCVLSIENYTFVISEIRRNREIGKRERFKKMKNPGLHVSIRKTADNGGQHGFTELFFKDTGINVITWNCIQLRGEVVMAELGGCGPGCVGVCVCACV